MPEGLFVSMKANPKPNSDVAKLIPVTTNQISSHFILRKPLLQLIKVPVHPGSQVKRHTSRVDTVSKIPLQRDSSCTKESYP